MTKSLQLTYNHCYAHSNREKLKFSTQWASNIFHQRTNKEGVYQCQNKQTILNNQRSTRLSPRDQSENHCQNTNTWQYDANHERIRWTGWWNSHPNIENGK